MITIFLTSSIWKMIYVKFVLKMLHNTRIFYLSVLYVNVNPVFLLLILRVNSSAKNKVMLPVWTFCGDKKIFWTRLKLNWMFYKTFDLIEEVKILTRPQKIFGPNLKEFWVYTLYLFYHEQYISDTSVLNSINHGI